MLVALGGGVVGDMTGFAAATLLRGIDFVQIPTTLLAQVDSSVGGKTGINTRTGKNLIGAFYQPRLVLADTDVLASLPRRELLAGYAETVKYGLIRDAEFFDWCERQGNALCALEPDPLRHAIVTSCAMKAAVVAADEREEGDRALLNFGHTFGHALEDRNRVFEPAAAWRGGGAWGWCWRSISPGGSGSSPAGEGERVRRHFAATGLPTRLADVGLAGIAGRSPARAYGQGQEGARRQDHADPAAPHRRRLCHEGRPRRQSCAISLPRRLSPHAYPARCGARGQGSSRLPPGSASSATARGRASPIPRRASDKRGAAAPPGSGRQRRRRRS